MKSHRISKKHVIIAVVLAALAVFAVYEIRWISYYNKMWEPLIEVVEKRGADGSLIEYEELKAKQVTYKGVVYTLFEPKNLEFDSNICSGHVNSKTFDDETGPPWYTADVLVWPETDGTYRWGVWIDKINSTSSVESICNVTVDPNTLEILSEDTSEDEKRIFKENEDMVREAIADMREFWSPVLN